MGLYPYPFNPPDLSCANCGRLMGEHPFKDPEPETCVGPAECEAFIDPEFVAGVDREEDEEIDTPEAWLQRAKDGARQEFLSKESTRSEVHGISTAGYADTNWIERCLTPDKSFGHPEGCDCAIHRLIKRREEIERVQLAFKRAWRQWFYCPEYPITRAGDRLNQLYR